MEPLAGRIFARRLREERVQAGLSQAALAGRVTEVLDQKLDASAITRIEKNERAVRLDEAVVIAELLDVSLVAMIRDRESVDEKIGELRRDLSAAQWRAIQAEEELQRAQDAIKGIQRLINDLEATQTH
ncbi:helix-turn-helix domain-containing protein [Paenarthrobacter nitroguajacolicus]|uniref:helix-turn-helix domain-containing protein n=1 Tax=Paenarthrobacter nitroguajacolicus TaxID=211146 RepID=UPI003ADE75A4